MNNWVRRGYKQKGCFMKYNVWFLKSTWVSYGFAHNNRFSFKCLHAAGALQICGHVLIRKNACAQDILPRNFDDTTCHVVEVKGYYVRWLCANSILGTSKKVLQHAFTCIQPTRCVYRKLTLKQDARCYSLVYWIESFLSWRRSEFSTRGKLAHGRQELILSRIPVDCSAGLNT